MVGPLVVSNGGEVPSPNARKSPFAEYPDPSAGDSAGSVRC